MVFFLKWFQRVVGVVIALQCFHFFQISLKNIYLYTHGGQGALGKCIVYFFFAIMCLVVGIQLIRMSIPPKQVPQNRKIADLSKHISQILLREWEPFQGREVIGNRKSFTESLSMQIVKEPNCLLIAEHLTRHSKRKTITVEDGEHDLQIAKKLCEAKGQLYPENHEYLEPAVEK